MLYAKVLDEIDLFPIPACGMRRSDFDCAFLSNEDARHTQIVSDMLIQLIQIRPCRYPSMNTSKDGPSWWKWDEALQTGDAGEE
jgi:hypothetical protein